MIKSKKNSPFVLKNLFLESTVADNTGTKTKRRSVYFDLTKTTGEDYNNDSRVHLEIRLWLTFRKKYIINIIMILFKDAFKKTPKIQEFVNVAVVHEFKYQTMKFY